MRASAEKAVRRLYDEVLNEGRLNVLDEITVENYAENDPLPGQGTGRSGLADRVTMLRVGLAPRFTLHDVIIDGDRAAVRWTNEGTHVGEFFGIPATGNAFTISGIDVYRLEHGKLAEHWHVVDVYALLIQLGVVPAPQGA